MFKKMKPLPKAITIAVLVAAPIWAYVQFAPKSEPKATPVVVEAPTPVPAESEAVKRAAALADTPVTAAPIEAAPQEQPKGNVSSGQAGLDALMKAGKK